MSNRQILSSYRLVLRGLKPYAPKKKIESLDFVKTTLLKTKDGNAKLFGLYAEYLTNLREHEDLLRRYKLISNVGEAQNVIKTAGMVGLNTVKPFEVDPRSHFDQFSQELKNVLK